MDYDGEGGDPNPVKSWGQRMGQGGGESVAVTRRAINRTEAVTARFPPGRGRAQDAKRGPQPSPVATECHTVQHFLAVVVTCLGRRTTAFPPTLGPHSCGPSFCPPFSL